MVVLVTLLALVVYKIRLAIAVGPQWDTYAFLANAAEFAGRGYGYTEAHRPPFLPFLVSLVFRVVPLQAQAIQWVDGALSASGIVAFYLLMRRRFQPLAASAGAVLLCAAGPLWEFIGVGYTDIAAVSLCLWTLLALIAATERDTRWYLVAGPVFMAAVLTRFTALLFLFPALVWLFLRWRPFAHARRLFQGALFSIAAYLPAAAYYQQRFGDALFPFLMAFTFNEAVSAPTSTASAGSGGIGWYLLRAPAFLAQERFQAIALGVLFVGVIGLLVAVSRYATEVRPTASRLAVAGIGIAVGVATQLVGGLILRQAAIPLAVLLVWRAVGPVEPGDAGSPRVTADGAFDAVMLAVLLTYADFHGHQGLHVARYFIPMAPSVVYLLVRGWLAAGAEAGGRLFGTDPASRRPLAEAFGVAVSAILLAVSLGNALSVAAATPRSPDPYVEGVKAAANWLTANEPHLGERVVYSDVWPQLSWYLGKNVRAMPTFTEARAFAHELDKADAAYYVTLRPRRFPAYSEVLDLQKVIVLRRTTGAVPDLPRIAYVGKSWDNYLERVCDYRFYLDSTAGRYGWEGSAFLDGYTGARLASADLVAVSGVRWHSRLEGERSLAAYLDRGGSVVIDASQNLGALAYSQLDTIMFDTVIRRGEIPRDAAITVDPSFAQRHADVASVSAGPFVDENGGPWGGAVYSARPGTPPLRTLVSAGGVPIVQVRDVGRGRVYWVGLNLFWHAFSKQSPSEQALVDAVLEDAMESGRAASSSASGSTPPRPAATAKPKGRRT